MEVVKEVKASGDASQAGVGGPAVSVVVPAYKVAPFIAETLDSVFAQTFRDFEVVVVNDGSPDTEELERALAPYAGRIRYFTQENRGAGAARNHGVREARGTFVAFLDGDDLWLPTYLEEQVRFIGEGGYDLTYTDAVLFGDSPSAGRRFMEVAPSEGAVSFRSLVRAECNVITSGVVARRDVVSEAGLFDESLRNAQDFDLWLRLARRGARLAYQRRPLVRYRVHEGSLSGDAVNRIERERRVYRLILEGYDLDASERAEVEGMLERLGAELDLEAGKRLLLEGKFAEARASLGRARRVLGGWKLGASLVLLKVAPRLLLKVAGGRLRTRA